MLPETCGLLGNDAPVLEDNVDISVLTNGNTNTTNNRNYYYIPSSTTPQPIFHRTTTFPITPDTRNEALRLEGDLDEDGLEKDNDLLVASNQRFHPYGKVTNFTLGLDQIINLWPTALRSE
eukprot:UN09813